MFRGGDHRAFSTLSVQHGLVGIYLSARRLHRMYDHPRQRGALSVFPRLRNHLLDCSHDSLACRLGRHITLALEGKIAGRTLSERRRGEGGESARGERVQARGGCGRNSRIWGMKLSRHYFVSMSLGSA